MKFNWRYSLRIYYDNISFQFLKMNETHPFEIKWIDKIKHQMQPLSFYQAQPYDLCLNTELIYSFANKLNRLSNDEFDDRISERKRFIILLFFSSRCLLFWSNFIRILMRLFCKQTIFFLFLCNENHRTEFDVSFKMVICEIMNKWQNFTFNWHLNLKNCLLLEGARRVFDCGKWEWPNDVNIFSLIFRTKHENITSNIQNVKTLNEQCKKKKGIQNILRCNPKLQTKCPP